MVDLPNKMATGQPVPPKKKIAPVVTGAKQVERPPSRRVLDSLFAESPRSLLGKVTTNVIVPRFKAGIEEALNNFLAGMLWGNGNRPTSNLVQGAVLRGGVGGINYANISNPMGQGIVPVQPSTSGYQDIVCPTQQGAEFVLANLYDLFNQYSRVAVGDLKELAGITPMPSDNTVGWMSLDGARITKERDGYRLALPQPRLL